MKRFFTTLLLIGIGLIGTGTLQAQYDIPDCFIAAAYNALPADSYTATRQRWYREFSLEWETMIAGLTLTEKAAYTAVFCTSLNLQNGGTQPSLAARWHYITVEEWQAEQNSPTSNHPSPALTLVTHPNDIFVTDFDDVPTELIVINDRNTRLVPQLQTEGEDNVLRLRARNFNRVYYNDPTLSDYALDVRARIHSGELMLTVYSGEDMCSGYEFGYAPYSRYAYIRVTDANCVSTTLEERFNIVYEPGALVNLRLEIKGDQLSAYVDGALSMSATVRRFSQGMPSLFAFSVDEQVALIDISSIRITPATLTEGVTLENYAAHPVQIIADLQDMNLIPEGGEFVTRQPLIYAAGRGSRFSEIAPYWPSQNFMMAARIVPLFKAANAYEACKFMARVTTRAQSAIEELTVVIDNEGNLILIDYADPNQRTPAIFDRRYLGNTLQDSYDLLILAQNNLVSVYLNGVLYFDRVQVEAREGTYGIGIMGEHSNSRCEAHDLWIYTLD